MLFFVIHLACTVTLVLASFLYWRSHREEVTVTKGVLIVWAIMVLFLPWATMAAAPITFLGVYLDEHGDEEVAFFNKGGKDD